MIGFFKRHVFHNFGLKLMSLILATALWFMISRNDRPAAAITALSSAVSVRKEPGS